MTVLMPLRKQEANESKLDQRWATPLGCLYQMPKGKVAKAAASCLMLLVIGSGAARVSRQCPLIPGLPDVSGSIRSYKLTELYMVFNPFPAPGLPPEPSVGRRGTPAAASAAPVGLRTRTSHKPPSSLDSTLIRITMVPFAPIRPSPWLIPPLEQVI